MRIQIAQESHFILAVFVVIKPPVIITESHLVRDAKDFSVGVYRSKLSTGKDLAFYSNSLSSLKTWRTEA